MYVYESVGAALAGAGVTDVFGLMGDGNLRFLSDIGDRGDIKWWSTRHEAAAIAMAEGYARSTGKVGVCSITQGPGVTNTITALKAAVDVRTPMLVLAGAAGSSLPGSFQYVDQKELFETCGAGVHPVRNAKSVADDIDRALRRAELERRPIGLFLTGEMQEQVTRPPNDTPLRAPHRSVQADAEAVQEALELISIAQRPVFIAGAGAVHSDAGQVIAALADHVGALLATSVLGRGLFTDHDHHLGISGDLSTGVASDLIGGADLVVSFGASLNFWTTCSGEMIPKTAMVLQIDHDESAIGRFHRTTYGVVGDVRSTAEALLEGVREANAEPSRGYRTDAVTQRIADFTFEQEFGALATGDRLDPRTAVLTLDSMLPAERSIAVDGGHFLGFPAMYMAPPDASGWLWAVNFGSIGLSLGTGLGAAVGRPDRLPVVMIGDGAMMMSLGDIDTAVRYNLPLLVFVGNDAAFGAEVHNLSMLGLTTDFGYYNDPDIAAIAAAMGASSITVRSVEDLAGLKPWLDEPSGPMVVDCKTDGTVVHPWIEEVLRRQVKYRNAIRARAQKSSAS